MKIGEVAFESRTRRDMAQRVRYELPADAKSGQDHYVLDVDHRLFAVADGVSDSRDGGEAAKVACDVFREKAPSYKLGGIAVMGAIPELYRELNAAVVETGSLTTFTGGIVTNDGSLVWLHAGDSRLFHLRNGELYDVTPQQHDPLRRHVIWNYLGGGNNFLELGANAYNNRLPVWGREIVSPGDRLIFATDGLGPTAFHDPRYETEWWMQRTDRELGRTARRAVECVADQSYIIDDGILIAVDIDA